MQRVVVGCRGPLDFFMEVSNFFKEGSLDEAFRQVGLMVQHQIPISREIIYHLLQECTRKKDLAAGRQVRSLMISSGLISIAVLGDFLIRLFASCGSLQEADEVFWKIPKPSAYTWNAIILAHARLGDGFRALELYHEMQENGMDPDKVTFSCSLKACIGVEAIDQGKAIHSQIIVKGFNLDVVVGSTLVDMYAKCGSIEEARTVFDRLPNQNVVSWGAMIAGYVNQGHGVLALELFKQMLQQGVKPDKILISCILKACGSIGAIGHGKLILDRVRRIGFEPDTVFQNTVVDMYAKCGELQEAREAFDKLPKKSMVSWGAMITGYAQYGRGLAALELFERMQEEVLSPDKVIFLSVFKACGNIGALKQGRQIHDQFLRSEWDMDVAMGSTLVDMYAKFGSVEEARAVFDVLPSRNIVSWSAMIAGYAQHGQGFIALKLFERMQQEDIMPDRVIYLCILRACGSVGALGQARLIHAKIIGNSLDLDVVIASTLLDAYAKCGSLDEARKVFDTLPVRDMVSWCAMVAGYGRDGNCRLAGQCLIDMQLHGLNPNSSIFSSVLAACRHSGLLEEGFRYFRCMREDYDIAPSLEHYSCMIDLLGRAGHLEEAEDMLQSMPVSPNHVLWMALLTCCRAHSNMELARRCFQKTVEVDPSDASAYMLMSSMYSDAHMWKDVDRIQELKKNAAAYKMPGMAWVEVNKEVHEFIVGGNHHPRSIEMYAKLKRVSRLMEESEYLPNLGLVLETKFDEDMKIRKLPSVVHGQCEDVYTAK